MTADRGDNLLPTIGCEGNPTTLIARAFRHLDGVEASWAHREFHRLCLKYGHPAEGPLYVGEDSGFDQACNDLAEHGWFLYDWTMYPSAEPHWEFGVDCPVIVVCSHTQVAEAMAYIRFNTESEAVPFANDLQRSGLWLCSILPVEGDK